jgi:hypothetical protein
VAIAGKTETNAKKVVINQSEPGRFMVTSCLHFPLGATGTGGRHRTYSYDPWECKLDGVVERITLSLEAEAETPESSFVIIVVIIVVNRP